MYDKIIRYDRESRDYRMELDGTLIGFTRTHHEAEVTLDQTVYELLTAGHFATATELDGGAPGDDDVPTDAPGEDCDDHGPYADDDCPKCQICNDGSCPWCARGIVYDGPMLMPEGDWLDIEGMRVVAPTSGMVVVQIAPDHDVQCDICDNARVIRGLGNEIPCPYCSAHAPESLREDCLNVVTMALGQTHGAASVVTELRRLKARLEAAAAA